MEKLVPGERMFVGAVTGGFIGASIDVVLLMYKYNQLVKEYNELARRARTASILFAKFTASVQYMVAAMDAQNVVLDDFDYIAINEMMREIESILTADTDFNGGESET